MTSMTLGRILPQLKYEGNISIRRDILGGTHYIGGGDAESVLSRFGGYKIKNTKIIDGVLVIYVI